jgi:RecA/RadA recombinase
MATPRTHSAASTSSSPDHRASVQKAIDSIVQRFGKGAIMALGGDPGDRQPVEAISTGSLNLDRALGVGGLPRGRIVEIFGPESSGKTTLMLHAIAEAQKKGLVCAFIDAEHALDVKYAAKLGVKLDELLISQPDCGEQALDIADTLARTGGVGMVVVDSVAALIPRAELEGDMGDQHLGLQARLMSQAMRKLAGIGFTTNTLVVFINQLRHKIGVTFGSPETTTGGNALKYFASVRPTSAGSPPSATARRPSPPAPASRSSRTSAPRPSTRPSSRSPSAPASTATPRCSTGRSRRAPPSRPAVGSRSTAPGSARAAPPRSSGCAPTPPSATPCSPAR